MAFIRPHRIRRTGDDTPAPGLFRFVVRMSGRHQIALVALSLVIAALNVARWDGALNREQLKRELG